MKIILTFYLLMLCFAVEANEKDFVLNGNVVGKEVFKYAYCFDNERNIIAKANIVGGRFVINGKHPNYSKFGEVPYLKILFSNDEKFSNTGELSNRRPNHCTAILTDSIHVTYKTDTHRFFISGGQGNALQNKFTDIYCTYRNNRDSAYHVIDRDDLSPEEKEELKVKAAKKLFLLAVFDLIELCKQNPASEVSLFNFSPIIFEQQIRGQEAAKVFDVFSDSLKRSQYGIGMKKNLEDKIRMEKTISDPAYTVGMIFPTFNLENDKGQQISWQPSSGKYTLIDFWATWCVPCRKETPNLLQSHKRYRSKGFEVITVSIDELKDKNKWIKAINDDRMAPLNNLFNGGDISGLSRTLKIVSIPANYLVDDKGVIIATDLRGNELELKLKQLLPN